MDLIDDDEWLELGMTLFGAMSRMPKGSRLVEALQVPAFRLGLSAAGADLPSVITRPSLGELHTPEDAVRGAVDLAETEYRFVLPSTPHALAVALTQTNDGETFAIAVVGLPGERTSFTTFDLPPGGHSIDVGEITLELLEGWAIRRDATQSAA